MLLYCTCTSDSCGLLEVSVEATVHPIVMPELRRDYVFHVCPVDFLTRLFHLLLFNQIDGVAVNLPVNLNQGDTVIYQHGMYTIIETGFGLTMSYGLAHGLSVTLPPEYTGHTCGLCGNFNGSAADDLVMQDGSLSKEIFHFAASWKSETVPSCDDGSSDSYPTCPQGEQLIQAKLKCWIIQDPKGPFASCHLQINPEPHFSVCIFDLCVSQGDRSTLCRSIEKYATACQRSNVNISAWRSTDFCGMYLRVISIITFSLCKCRRKYSPFMQDKVCNILWV